MDSTNVVTNRASTVIAFIVPLSMTFLLHKEAAYQSHPVTAALNGDTLCRPLKKNSVPRITELHFVDFIHTQSFRSNDV